MAKQPPNAGKRWTPTEVKQLDQLAKGNTPTRVIGLKLGRTPDAVESKAQQEGNLAEADESITVRNQPLLKG